MDIEEAPPGHPGTPRVLRPTQRQSTLKTTRRATWNSLISRLDKEQYTVFSCWLLLITSLCLFVVLLLTFGKQFCIVVFLSISALVVLFVVFIQPPEGAYRRQAVRELLSRHGPTSGGVVGAAASAQSPEHVTVAPAGSTTPLPQQLQQKKPAAMGGLKMKEPSHQGPPAYELRKASMMFEKYDDTCRPNLPPRPSTSAAPASKEPKRGLFRSFLARIRKGHLQANPYYTTLTEDGESNEEVGEPPAQPHAEATSSPKRDVPAETRKRIGFQERPAPVVDAEQHADGVRRNRRLMSMRPTNETEMSSRGKIDRSTSVFTSVTPSSGATGLKPLKSGVKGTSTPRLGVSAKKPSGTAPRRTVNFSGVNSPPLSKKAPPPRLLKVDDWRKAADSSASTSEDGVPDADSCLLFTGPPKAPEPSNVKRSYKHRGSRASLSSPDLKMGPSKTYTMRDAMRGIRKVHHVWSL